jgi:2,3-bisphosphoglycerate-independent phosphoglycerate mutase
MVGHTGIMSAAIKACEAVDKCVEKWLQRHCNDYTILIADHGNCETMINLTEAQIPHTTNPVPIILVDKEWKNYNRVLISLQLF